MPRLGRLGRKRLKRPLDLVTNSRKLHLRRAYPKSNRTDLMPHSLHSLCRDSGPSFCARRKSFKNHSLGDTTGLC